MRDDATRATTAATGTAIPENIELLTANHLPYHVVNIIEKVQEFRPICPDCWAQLPKEMQKTIAAMLA